MKTVIIAIIFLFITTFVFSDEIEFPFTCNVTKAQEVFKLNGMKLDLSGNEKTDDSWGYIESRGSKFILYSYKTLTREELQLIENIVFGR